MFLRSQLNFPQVCVKVLAQFKEYLTRNDLDMVKENLYKFYLQTDDPNTKQFVFAARGGNLENNHGMSNTLLDEFKSTKNAQHSCDFFMTKFPFLKLDKIKEVQKITDPDKLSSLSRQDLKAQAQLYNIPWPVKNIDVNSIVDEIIDKIESDL